MKAHHKRVAHVLLDRYQLAQVMNSRRPPAAEQALVTLLLSPDKTLIRDRWGRWNHIGASREVRAQDGLGNGFNTGYKDRTIAKIIDTGRARTVTVDDRGRPIKVSWVPI